MRALALSTTLLFTAACAHGSGGASSNGDARQALIQANMWELQACWTDIVAEHPGRAGSLLFTVDIRRNGTVEWVDIEIDELQVPKLGACAVKHIKKWRFPEDRRRQSIRFGVGFAGIAGS